MNNQDEYAETDNAPFWPEVIASIPVALLMCWIAAGCPL